MRAAVQRTSTFGRVWAVPLALGALTTFGLLAALLGTGVWHVLAWTALVVPVVVGVCFAFMRPAAVPPARGGR
jgi:hypothetical protein